MRLFHIEAMITDEYYWYWMCNIKGIGNKKQHYLLEHYGNARNVYEAGMKELMTVKGITNKDAGIIINSRSDDNIRKSYYEMKEKGVSFVHIGERDYPKKLNNIYDSPIGLYYKGKLPHNNIPSVAVVGARACSAYGKEIAYSFSKEFARMGIQVISGMAVGVDSYAHRGCIEGDGYTCAVLGCGVDICYPAGNISLYSDISAYGGIISEYPVGTLPLAYRFPERNRIISGLCDAIVLVEAKSKSGSLITTDQGLEQNREIFVVPGRINDKLSEGCNELIKQGAALITTPEDILSVCNFKVSDLRVNNDDKCNFFGKECENNSADKINLLAREKNIVYSVLDLYPKSMDNIIEETKLDISVISEALLMLQLEGSVKEVSQNNYIRCT